MQSEPSGMSRNPRRVPIAEANPAGEHSTWYRWTLGTFLALTIPLLVADLFAFPMVVGNEEVVFCCDNSIGVMLVFAFFLVVLPGPLLGIIQGKVLGRLPNFRRAKSWAVVTTVAFIIVEITLMAQRFNLSLDVIGLVTALVPGAILGLAQFFLLRKEVRGARWWIAVNSAALAVGAIAGILVGTTLSALRWSTSTRAYPFYPLDTLIYWLIGWAVAALIFALLTGYTIERLFRSPLLRGAENPDMMPPEQAQAPVVPLQAE